MSLRTESDANTNRTEKFLDHLQDIQQASKLDEVIDLAVFQDVSEGTLKQEAEDNSAVGMQTKALKAPKKEEVKTEKAKRAQESVLIRREETGGLAGGFSGRQGNQPYRLNLLLFGKLAEQIGVGIHEELTPDQVVSFVEDQLTEGQLTNKKEPPDVAIVDKALEFLVEVAGSYAGKAEDSAKKERLEKIHGLISEAKLNHFQKNEPDILIAQNIIGVVDAVAQNTGQTIKATLDRYRQVVHHPPAELQELQKYYENKGYQFMVSELKGFSKYLGRDLKQKDLESPELAQLINAVRNIQALHAVYKIAKNLLPTAESYLKLHGVLGA